MENDEGHEALALGFGFAPLKTEGAPIPYSVPRPVRHPVIRWIIEARRRVVNAYWALKGDSGW